MKCDKIVVFFKVKVFFKNSILSPFKLNSTILLVSHNNCVVSRERTIRGNHLTSFNYLQTKLFKKFLFLKFY